MKKLIFGFLWGAMIAVIISTLGGRVFVCWQYWVGLLIPVIGIFVCEE